MQDCVLHLEQNLSQEALQGRICSSTPLMHGEEHGVQAVSPLVLAKLVPSVQDVHAVLPALAEMVPGRQGVHLAVSLEMPPLNVPAEQVVHVVDLYWSAYFPPVHAVQVLAVFDVAEKVPGRQKLQKEAAWAEKVPAEQPGHAEDNPVEELYVPAEQLVQAVLPDKTWLLPAGHGVQTELPLAAA